ncbi:hypothetical protein AVEN_4686-1 [Araneus ventricosus]|uniref:Mos1 transposase HTH domain-containing protein n=1 Tax=Araneus ventricosus TaxID=182803 RepID=A0A4Y2QTH4_ARAVE|nr:hypothetical protein AVEN_115780-1 [Araneus ventricosus]GBN66692.1 hypothetical protein AVEN_245302-1 [Araneus ventricosus]GBN69593.1 hypothetical protein AVEN_105244-1 [Araneus ventricosus]GBN69621.1 hypothetical protein AVEN_4686-1 [Araneus ventricosus]
MFKKTETPADYEIRSVISLSTARNVKTADMHHSIFEVYGDNAMSDSKVRKLVRLFKKVGETSKSNRILTGHLQSIAKYWQLCFGTGRVCCYSTFYNKGLLFRHLKNFLSDMH